MGWITDDTETHSLGSCATIGEEPKYVCRRSDGDLATWPFVGASGGNDRWVPTNGETGDQCGAHAVCHVQG